ncbi:glycoside hydrolase family 47 protein [Saccharata proteae CBS 121410]|uniref:alpha-1,2-Mannosidase n=1 Tax=Saccharata proteae CBS 121410 TaxID=1314787 RepID=A0A9P4LW59_9PEZI|nr:glycoside hydrolase family 47 protein [Saccharata proteae CBS 121410]
MFLRRKTTLLAFLALVVVFLFLTLPSNSPHNDHLAQDSLSEVRIQPIETPEQLEDAESIWSQFPQRYPVEDMTPMPQGAKKIPQIQHPFPKETAQAREAREARLDEVKQEFLHAWTGYKKNAWLSDEVAPISGDAKNTFGGWAATLVDSLDALWIMGLKDEFEEAVHAIEEIDFTTTSQKVISVFETTIRYLGGFLSAYDLTDGQYPALLQKAKELGNMLYVAFDTPNRMPVTYWKPQDALNDVPQEAGKRIPSADIGSLTMEFTRLSQLTGDLRFFDAAQRITDLFEAAQNQTRLPGMWPLFVDAKNLDFVEGGGFTIGAMADSLYEYLPKQHLLLGGATDQYRTLFEDTAKPMKEHLFYRPLTRKNEDILLPGDVNVEKDGLIYLDPRNQHLSCYVGGMFGIAGKIFENPEDVAVGKKLAEGCIWAYEASPNGIMPEIMRSVPCEDAHDCVWDEKMWLRAVSNAHNKAPDPEAVVIEEYLGEGITKVDDPKYILRPEAIESVFILYRITGDESLRERGWNMFKSIIEHTRTPIAHAGLDNCLAPKPPKQDSMESFWTAETLKYFYLLFAEPEVVSLDKWVLNTEAHPLRRPGGGT